MRNNKKGFTLTELIAVIVILSLIISLATISVLAIRKNVLKKDYNNLVTYLETKAAEYANETNITTISVEDLIKEGVVSPDDQTTIYNPENKESMNCYIIKSTFENGKYVAKISENERNSDGTCKKYEKTGIYSICVYNEETKKCENISGKWYKDDVKLGIKYTNNANNVILDAENATYNWTSTNGFTSTEKIIKTETNSVNQSAYKCEVTINDKVGEASAKVNIDKQAPAIDEIELNTGWAAKKDVIIKANDMGGSGISGFALVKENETCQKYTSDNKFEIKEEGTYKYCVKDVAGNITTDTIKVENIDSSIPATPVITPSDGRSQDKWHTADFTLAFSSQIENNKSTITYYFGTSKNNLVLIGNEVAINSSYSRKTIYVKACNEAKMCSGVSSYTVLYDNTAPTYASGGSIGQGSVSKPSYTDNAGGSGNVTVYTCVTTGKVPTNADSCFSSSQTTYSYSCGTTFRLYSYAVDAAGNKSAVYDHATNNGATYYKTCYSGGGSSYGGGGSSGGSSGGRSHSSSCDTSCQMKQNSEAWHNTTNQAERDRLHRENQRLAEKNNSCGSGCSFDSGSGNWKNSSGKNLYEVSGGKKR